MKIELKKPTRELFQRMRMWRNQEPETHSDEQPLAPEWQDQFYSIYVINEQPERKYFSIIVGEEEVGVCGLKNLNEYSGSIIIILDPKHRNKGIGKSAILELLKYAKSDLGLKSVFGAVNYENFNGLAFWNRMCEEFGWTRIMQFGVDLT